MSKHFTDHTIHIIGAGIAGLSAGVYLARLNQDVVIYERKALSTFEGMGFLLAKNGVDVLKSLFAKTLRDEQLYLTLESLTLHNVESHQTTTSDAQGMWGVLRPPLIDRLKALYLDAGGVILNDHHLTRLEFEGEPERVKTLVFETPEGTLKQRARLVLGADGIYSKVRASLFPDARLREYLMTEFVGISPRAALRGVEQSHSAQELVKYYAPRGRQAFGYMHLPDHNVIWYAQMSRDDHLPTEDGPTRQRFLLDRYHGWPEEVGALLRHCDFSRTYRWDSKDLDVTPATRGGVMLIGDAAHASLTLSSQGVASAIEDAALLSELLGDATRHELCTPLIWDQVCHRFNESQRPTWLRRQSEARELQRQFLSAQLADRVPVVNT